MVSSAFFSVICPFSRPTRLTTIFTLSARLFMLPNDMISRTTFRRHGRSNCVTSRIWLAISRADQVRGGVRLRQVEHQVRKRGFQQADDALQVVGRDQRDVFQLHGPRQQVQAGGMLRQRAFQQGEIEPRNVLGHVHQRIVGNRVEKHVGVAQAEIEIDQGHGVFRILSEDATEVDGQTGRAHPPMAPATAITRLPRRRLSPPRPKRRSPIRPNAASRSSIFSGWVRNSLAPRPERLQDQAAVVGRTDDQDGRQSGEAAANRSHQASAFLAIGIDGHQSISGLVCATTSAKNS